MKALLQCLSHSPLFGIVDPERAVLDEVDAAIKRAAERIAEFDPELVVLFSPDHYNGFFYDVMPPFCIGAAAHAIGDFGTAKGDIRVPSELAEVCVETVMEFGVDVAFSRRMQVDHGFAQPLEFLLGGLDRKPVIPIFINGVAVPLPDFKRARLLGEAVGTWARSTRKRTLFIGSGGLSHQPPVPEFATAPELVRENLLGAGKNLSPQARAERTQRVIDAAHQFIHDQHSLHPLNPVWDQAFMDILSVGRMAELDGTDNSTLSEIAGKSVHEVKTWVAACSAMSVFDPYRTTHRYYREIPEWICGFGVLSAQPA